MDDSARPNEQSASDQISIGAETADSLTEDASSLSGDGVLRLNEGDSFAEAKRRDDGLVDIRIDSSLRMISNILSSVRKPQFESETRYVLEQTVPIYQAEPTLQLPALNIVVHVVGSRGDLQPFIPISQELQKHGHRVRIATHLVFRTVVENEGIEFFDIGGDPAELMAYMVNNPTLLPSYGSAVKGELRRKREAVRQIMERCWLSCFAPGEVPAEIHGTTKQRAPQPFIADAIIANPPSFAHLHCAQKLGIPFHIVFTYVVSSHDYERELTDYTECHVSATRTLSHPLAKIRSTNLDETMSNYFSFTLVEMLIWQGLKGVVNSFRKRTLGLEPINSSWGPSMLQKLKIPITYCWSPNIIPKPNDWGSHINVVGFCYQHSRLDFNPPQDLEDFLMAGPPPIYIGFGSIVVDNPQALTSLVFEAIDIAGVRAVVSQGWSRVGTYNARRSNILLIDSCPHDWLFSRVSCVVHHAGAGTTAAGLRAGKPTVAMPFFGDQFFWANMISRVGAGPQAVPYKDLTAGKLADAISLALSSEFVEAAKRLSVKIENENGALGVSSCFHTTLPLEAMRCAVDPTRTATWRLRQKKSRMNISAFAAAVLQEQGLIDFKHLEPFRPVEYKIDQGPWEPLGSSIASTTGLMFNVLKGFGEMATEMDTIATKIGAMGQKDAGTAITYSMPSSSSTKSAARKPKVGENLLSGAGTVVGATLRAPGNFTLALANGSHNMPRLWHDRMVREQNEITGIGSGIAMGFKELVLGTYDGISGIFTQPYEGAREGGFAGMMKGFGKGIAGVPTKFFAAAAAPVAYPLKGFVVQVTNAISRKRRDPIVVARIEQGEWERLKSSDKEKEAVVERWKALQAGYEDVEV